MNAQKITDFKRAIYLADKYIRKKEYGCLFPECKKKAIRSHAIPRSSLIEALAKNGKLYTINQSFNSVFRKTSPHDPMEIVKIGVNNASVFKGFCQGHDTKLFAPIETTHEAKKKSIAFSFHLRALALEYCRKRRSADIFEKMIEFHLPEEILTICGQRLELYRNSELYVGKLLESMFFPLPHNSSGQIDYFGFPFSKNLGVSCCGVFNYNDDLSPSSVIGYNILAYKNFSILMLTSFGCQHTTLDSFVGGYRGTIDSIEAMVNDIAFLKGEEPLIAAELWESLSENQKHGISSSLVHPAYRIASTCPRIVKIRPDQMLKNITPEVLAKLGSLTAALLIV